MSDVFERIKQLIASGSYSISNHAYEEMEKDDILPQVLLDTVGNSKLVEDYPKAHRGATVLICFTDKENRPLHAVWGIPKLNRNVVVLVTAYRPTGDEWSKDFLRRLKQ